MRVCGGSIHTCSKEKSIEGYRVIACTVTTFVSRIHVGDHTHFCCDFTHIPPGIEKLMCGYIMKVELTLSG